MARHVPHVPAAGEAWAYYTVAALIAGYDPKARPVKDRMATEPPGEEAVGPERTSRLYRRNLGSCIGAFDAMSMSRHRAEEADGDDLEGPSAKRLQYIARDDLIGVHTTLPGLLRRIADGPMLPDWGVLLHDLALWEHDQARESVTARWFSSYYTTLSRPTRAESED